MVVDIGFVYSLVLPSSWFGVLLKKEWIEWTAHNI